MGKNMKFFVRVRTSIFSIKNYPMLIKGRFTNAISYALILSLIVGSILGISQFALLNLVEKSSKEIIKQDDFAFELRDGILDFKKSVYMTEETEAIVLIDTNKSLSDKETLRKIIIHKNTSIAVLRDGIIVRGYGEEYEIRYSDIPMIPKFVDNNIMIKALDEIAPLKYLLVVVSIIATFIKMLIYALIVSITGVLVSKIKGIKIKYREIFKISIYSMTLPFLLQLILPVSFLMIVISSLYVVLSVNYFKE